MIFNYALKNKFIIKNAGSFLDLGKREKVIDRKIFTNEEINIL